MPRTRATSSPRTIGAFMVACVIAGAACTTAEQGSSGSINPNESATNDQVNEPNNQSNQPNNSLAATDPTLSPVLDSSDLSSLATVGKAVAGSTSKAASSKMLAVSGTSMTADSSPGPYNVQEVTYNLPYAMLTSNSNGYSAPPQKAYILSLFNYDPCAYESANGRNAMPAGGKKVEVYLYGEKGDGSYWNIFPLALNPNDPNAAKPTAQLVEVDASTKAVSRSSVASGTVDLTAFSSGGSGKSFPTGSGTINMIFSSAPGPKRVVGLFNPTTCSVDANKTKVDAAPAFDGNAFRDRIATDSNLSMVAYSAGNSSKFSGALAAVPANYKAQIQSAVFLQDQPFGMTGIYGTGSFFSMPYMTMTYQAGSPSEVGVLTLFNYDPCAYESVNGINAMPVGGIKAEFSNLVFSLGGSKQYTRYGNMVANRDPNTLQGRLVFNTGNKCQLTKIVTWTGFVDMIGGSTEQNSAVASGPGNLKAQYAGLDPNHPEQFTIQGAFSPLTCAAQGSQILPSKDPNACIDSSSFRTARLF